jgi:hypothetical protein
LLLLRIPEITTRRTCSGSAAEVPLQVESLEVAGPMTYRSLKIQINILLE